MSQKSTEKDGSSTIKSLDERKFNFESLRLTSNIRTERGKMSEIVKLYVEFADHIRKEFGAYILNWDILYNDYPPTDITSELNKRLETKEDKKQV